MGNLRQKYTDEEWEELLNQREAKRRQQREEAAVNQVLQNDNVNVIDLKFDSVKKDFTFILENGQNIVMHIDTFNKLVGDKIIKYK